jgi:hypothetical protein
MMRAAGHGRAEATKSGPCQPVRSEQPQASRGPPMQNFQPAAENQDLSLEPTSRLHLRRQSGQQQVEYSRHAAGR